MTPEPPARHDTGVRLLLIGLTSIAAISAVAYLVVALQRVVYPYDIDFVEDGMLMQALRVAEGQALYVAPNAEFASHVYMPLTTWLGALLMRLSEPSFAPLRLLSLAATLATAGLISLIARCESRNGWIAFVCGCLYLAGYRIAGGWYDLVRVDAVFVLLALAGVAAAVAWHDRLAGQLASALLLALSYLAKQNGLYFGVVVAVYLVLVEGRRAWPFVAAFAGLVAVPTLWLQAASNGWFSTYVFDIAFASPTEWPRAAYTFGVEILGDMGALAVLAAGLALAAFSRSGRRALRHQPWLLFIAAACLAAVAGRASVGGARNQLIQAYAFLCLAPALIWREASAWAKPQRAQALIAVTILVQFGLAALAPVGRFIRPEPATRYAPTAEMRQAGDRLIERLAATPGDVLVMMHPFYAVQAGKAPSAQIQALWHARLRGREPLPADLVARIRDQRYAAIVSDQSPYFETEPALMDLLDRYYQPGALLTPADAPPTLSGLIVRPSVVYVPR